MHIWAGQCCTMFHAAFCFCILFQLSVSCFHLPNAFSSIQHNTIIVTETLYSIAVFFSCAFITIQIQRKTYGQNITCSCGCPLCLLLVLITFTSPAILRWSRVKRKSLLRQRLSARLSTNCFKLSLYEEAAKGRSSINDDSVLLDFKQVPNFSSCEPWM